MTHAKTLAPLASESTDLERRVLAHERILQALIAYMARTEPRFVDHLRERFVEPMKRTQREHDHRETDDYAEEFIRAVMLLGEVRAPKAKEAEITKKATRATEWQRGTRVFHEPANAARWGSGERKKRHVGGAGRWQVPRRLPPEGTCPCGCGLAQAVAPMIGSTHATVPQDFSIQVAENEGMPMRSNPGGSSSPPAPTRRLTGTLTLGLSRTRAATGGIWSAKEQAAMRHSLAKLIGGRQS